MAEETGTEETGSTETGNNPPEKGNTESKPDTGDATGGKPAEGSKESSDNQTALDAYKDLKFDEGLKVDKKALASFKTAISTMNGGKGLSQEDAQNLVNLRAAQLREQHAAQDQIFSEWRGEILKDPEIGGDKFHTVTAPRVLKAAEEFGGPEFVELLKTERVYGENPFLIRFLNKVGTLLEEDKLGAANRRSTSGSSEAQMLETLYPTHAKG